MIDLCTKEFEGVWFGVACAGKRIVATALDSTRERALKSIMGSISPNVKHQVVEEGSDFAEKAMHMLKELHAGNEESKIFTLADEYIPAPAASVLKIAAAIPLGYVASYGDIAKAAETGPRIVGRIMASNPLYPIVPCHRVVGADFSLVGYGGGKSPRALRAKLARLSREAKGFTAKREIMVGGKSLTVYPVEHVLQRAKERRMDTFNQQRLSEG